MLVNPESNLAWEHSQQGDADVLRVSGSFCLLSAEKLDEFRELAKGLDNKRCVFDMREVTYIDSAGLGVIALIARFAAANSTTVVVVPSPQVKKLILSTGLDRAVLFADSIPAALDAKPEAPMQ